MLCRHGGLRLRRIIGRANCRRWVTTCDLIPPIYVKPYGKRGKNDAADAAICEAMSRPGMRFVPVKSEDQQATLMLHKTREIRPKQKTLSVNALRGHLFEFGVVAAKRVGRVDERIEKAESDAKLPEIAKATVKISPNIWKRSTPLSPPSIRRLPPSMRKARSADCWPVFRGSERSRPRRSSPAFRDFSNFKSGRDFAAWLGSTPRQNSSGGKEKLGSITKQGNRYIRRRLVLGATSLLRVAGKRKGVLRDWMVALLARKPARLVTAAWPISSHRSYGLS